MMTAFRGFNFSRFHANVSCAGSMYRASYRRLAAKSVSELRDDFQNKSNFDEFKDHFRKKVIYHSFYKYEDFVLSKQKEVVKHVIKQRKLSKVSPEFISLKYIFEDENELSCDKENLEEIYESSLKESVVLPYEVSKLNLPETDLEDFDLHSPESDTVSTDNSSETVGVNKLICDQNFQTRTRHKWMKDYDCYEEIEEDQESDFVVDGNSLRNKYGTPNPCISMSKVPCGGCGALLHCQDPGIPGYLPSEIFTSCDVKELRSITCQRCHFMKNYNTALSISVDPKSYPKLLSRIRNEKALVILLVDITDFPCSIWPGILDIIGPRRPLFVIGNKVDLLVGDRKGWIRRVKESLRDALPKDANVIYSSLISAKTGFGVEELINKLHNVWQYKGNVYLVGCTNVGKSTLFNALLGSDYCKVQASDLIQRATTAPWPGTTLNLLKFPVLRPSGVRLFLRTKRLIEDRLTHAAEKKLYSMQTSKLPVSEPVQLVGRIGRSFSKVSEYDDRPDPFQSNTRMRTKDLPRSGLNPEHRDYINSNWLYDTPGVVHPDQIIDLLTTEELMKTLPKTHIYHRVFIFKKGWTLFIAGLGRMDLLELSEVKDNFMKIVVFCPETLPVIICETSIADELYNEFVGTPMFVVPCGGPDRLEIWPPLKPCDDIVLQGISDKESCADVVLSNAGWVAITPNTGVICKLRCWTPNARGIHVRNIPLMRHAVSVHGKRIHKTPAYSSKYLKEAAADENMN